MNNIYSLFQDYFKSFNIQKGRRALIKGFGDNNTAIAATDILIYLIQESYSTDPDVLKKYDGFIVRSNEQIELETGCTKFNNSSKHIQLLIDNGLIERRKDLTSYHKTRYKINVDVVVEFLTDNLTKLEEEKLKYHQKQDSIKEKKKIYWNEIGEQLQEKPTEQILDALEEKGVSLADALLIYTVNKIYKEVTGQSYKWSAGEFNTLKDYYGKGKIFNENDKEKLKEAISTLDEVDWTTKKYKALRIRMRLQGYSKYSKEGNNNVEI